MRIIGGQLRGRRIAAPPGRGTRPMLDRVREALFSTLAPWLPEARVLDLYAGTGSLGIEALSRGARAVHAIERDPRVVELLSDNVRELDLRDRVELLCADALAPASWDAGDEPYDVVFLDPPYPFVRDERRRRRLLGVVSLLARRALAADGVLVCHAPRGVLSAEDFGPELVVRERVYGSNALWYVQLDDEPGAASEATEEGVDGGESGPG